MPIYLLVANNAGVFTAYTSSDGIAWTAIPGSTVTLNLGSSLLAGLAVTSHNTGVLSTAVIDSVSVTNTVPPPPPPPPPPPCPTGWNCADIGNPALAGGQSLSGSTWTIQGGGADIYGTADQFHYVWQPLAGDGSVSAQVTSQTNTSAWAKAGVMLRATTDPGSPNYAAYITPGNGVSVQVRTSQGGTTAKRAVATGTVPIYLKVTRAGTTFSAYSSGDGVTWTLVPNSTMTLGVTGPMLEGLAVTSHNTGALCTVNMNAVVTS